MKRIREAILQKGDNRSRGGERRKTGRAGGERARDKAYEEGLRALNAEILAATDVRAEPHDVLAGVWVLQKK